MTDKRVGKINRPPASARVSAKLAKRHKRNAAEREARKDRAEKLFGRDWKIVEGPEGRQYVKRNGARKGSG